MDQDFGLPGFQGMDDPLGKPVDDMTRLIQATLNEKNSPEILQYQGELVASMEAALRAQEEYCEHLEQDLAQELKRMMLSLEVRRVRYLLKLYYKTRLQKIEKFAATIMTTDSMKAKLSDAEASYCDDYFVLIGRYLTDNLLKKLPDDYNGLIRVSKQLSSDDDLIPQPLMDTHVFCKLVADAGPVTLDEGQTVDMHTDDLFMLRYRAVAHLVANQTAVLI